MVGELCEIRSRSKEERNSAGLVRRNLRQGRRGRVRPQRVGTEVGDTVFAGQQLEAEQDGEEAGVLTLSLRISSKHSTELLLASGTNHDMTY